jgi:hypothetical protein
MNLELIIVNFLILPIYLTHNNKLDLFILNYQYRFYSHKAFSTRVKGPKTPTAPDLTDFQKEVIFGSMLEDLSAEKSQLTGNTRLRFYMSVINKDYILYLYSIFKLYVKTPPKEIDRNINKLTGDLHRDIYFFTLKYSLFNSIIEDFYIKISDKNIKIVPKNAYQKLTPVSLAFWVMNNGSSKIYDLLGNVTLCTETCVHEWMYYVQNL